MLRVGLEMAGCEEKRQNRVCRATQIANFKDMHGAEPVVCTEIWHDLQTTTIPEARINTGFRSCTMRVFLISLRFLKKCDTWKGRSASSGKGKNFCHTWGWCFLGKVAALRGQKIVWPEDDAWTTDFVIGIDGVHCRFHEVVDPTLFKTQNSSHTSSMDPALAASSPCLFSLMSLFGSKDRLQRVSLT